MIYNNSVNILFALNVQTTVYNGMIQIRDIEILITYVILSYFFPQHKKHLKPATVAITLSIVSVFVKSWFRLVNVRYLYYNI